MEFRILGPIEVADGDTLLALGGLKQRALLALLLLSANEIVSADRLIDQLWGEHSPESGRTALQVLISQLRKALGGASGQLITRAPGYILRLDHNQLDSQRFERLVAEADTSEPALAASTLRRALALWRGPPLDDLAYESFAQATIARLQELRLTALEKRIDADLALRQHAELVAELQALTAEHPLRERLACQLMLALYRSGRQADALDAYQRTRAHLTDALGLEPSPELAALQTAILNHDVTLSAQPPPAPASQGQLPVPATAFLGRGRERNELTTLLRAAGTRLLTLTGAGGSGKTRLALRVAEECALSYRGGIWFVGFAGIVNPERIVATINHAIGLADEPDVPPIRTLESWAKDRQLLLVLDNLEQLASDTVVLGELLACCPGVTLLVTSREPLHLAGEQQYEVPVLAQVEAVELFTARAAAAAPHVHVDSALAGEICERLDCLPLAIELAAARVKAFSPTDIHRQLDGSLAFLTGGPRDAPQRQRTLRATIDWSYALLNREEQLLFARLAVFGGGCTLQAAQAVCEAELNTLHALVDRSLVRSDGERYAMLQTIREYALERLEHTEQELQLRCAHAGWLIGLLETEGLPPPGWPDERSLTRVAPERENFAAALEWSTSSSMFETCARLAAPLVGVWVMTGQLQEAERWITLALEHEGDYEERLAAQVLSATRALAWNRGDHLEAAALTERALARWTEVGDLQAIGQEMVSRGMVAADAGDLARARAAYQSAIRYAREHALTSVLPVALIDLGDLEITNGDLKAGRTLCEESRSLAAPGSDSAVIARINLAHIAMLEARPTDAANLAREALAATLRAGSALTLAWSTIATAWPLAELGELERSAQLLGSGIEFFERTGAKLESSLAAAKTGASTILHAQLDEQTVHALLDEGRKTLLEKAARDALNESNALADA